MPTTEQLIRALKCCSSIYDDNNDCSNCQYCVLDRVDPKYGIEGDVEIDGVEYWTGCDIDRILADAANKLQSYKDGLI